MPATLSFAAGGSKFQYNFNDIVTVAYMLRIVSYIIALLSIINRDDAPQVFELIVFIHEF